MSVVTGQNTDDHVDPIDPHQPNKPRSPRYMHTSAQLSEDGALHATTRTWTDILLGGFHGGVQVLLVDANGKCCGKSPVHVFGVDGKLIGTHDRTDDWTASFDPGIAAATVSLKFSHTWNPQWMQAVQSTVNWIGMAIAAIAQAEAQNGEANLS